MNTVLISGNLTRDVELRRTGTGRTVASFSVACNHKYVAEGQERESTDYIPISVWGPAAEIVARDLRKGMRVFVSGRFNMRTYIDKHNEKRYMTEVVAEYVSKSVTAANDWNVQSAQPAPVPNPLAGYMPPQQGTLTPIAAAVGNFSTFGQAVPDEDIPF